MISAGSDEPVAILIPGTVHHCGLVRMDCCENLGETGCHRCIYYCQVTSQTCPDFGSQSLMGCWLSLLPDTTMPLCGCQSTHLEQRINKTVHLSTLADKTGRRYYVVLTWRLLHALAIPSPRNTVGSPKFAPAYYVKRNQMPDKSKSSHSLKRNQTPD